MACLDLVYGKATLPTTLHGYLHLVGDSGIIKINNQDPEWRQRLAFAHELWHLMDHKWNLNMTHEHVHQWAIGSALAEKNNISYKDITQLLKLSIPEHIFNEHMTMFVKGMNSLKLKDQTMYDSDKSVAPIDLLEKLMALTADFQTRAMQYKALYDRHLITEQEYQSVLTILGTSKEPVRNPSDLPERLPTKVVWTETALASRFGTINNILENAKNQILALSTDPAAEPAKEKLKAKAVEEIMLILKDEPKSDYSFDISSII